MSGVEIQHKGSQWVKYEVTALDRKNNEVDKVINLYEKVVDYKYELKPIYEIYAVRENSPAFKAGLKEGDQVIKINGKKAINLKIDYFNDLFTSEEGKEITIVVDRKGRYITFKFQLEKVL
jgi:C-terminal processing protease CtpA/Prc